MRKHYTAIISLILLCFCSSSYLYSQQTALTIDSGLNFPLGINYSVSNDILINEFIGIRAGFNSVYLTYPQEYMLVKESFRSSSVHLSAFVYSGDDITDALILGAGGGLNRISDWFCAFTKYSNELDLFADNGFSTEAFLCKNFPLYKRAFLSINMRFNYFKNNFNYVSCKDCSEGGNLKYYTKARDFFAVAFSIGLGLSSAK